jgi:zinc/manganese transport system ATP-binding protein
VTAVAAAGAPAGEVLALSGVSVSLAGRPILTGIDLTVAPGQFVGVIGPNGAGKTTLLRLILGLVAPTAGSVRLLGEPARRGSRHIGYVPQRDAEEIDMPLRARDLVALGLDGERWGLPLPSRERRRKVDAMLERVGAMHYADAPVGELSGGERQRLLVAQALVAQPRLLLLDEPLSNLDIASARETVRLVRELATERRIGVLLVAHDMNPLLGAMDRVLYLARGRAAVGGVDEVVRSDVLSSLYGYPVEVVRAQGRILVVAGEDVAALPNDRPHADEAPSGRHIRPAGGGGGR